MAKKVVGFIKLQIPAGKANPSPPVGPALGQRGLNIMEFCKAFNAKTQSYEPGLPLPVVITAFADKSFTFIITTPPASVLLKKAIKLDPSSADALLSIDPCDPATGPPWPHPDWPLQLPFDRDHDAALRAERARRWPAPDFLPPDGWWDRPEPVRIPPSGHATIPEDS